jgi:hypothetical protein
MILTVEIAFMAAIMLQRDGESIPYCCSRILIIANVGTYEVYETAEALVSPSLKGLAQTRRWALAL